MTRNPKKGLGVVAVQPVHSSCCAQSQPSVAWMDVLDFKQKRRIVRANNLFSIRTVKKSNGQL